MNNPYNPNNPYDQQRPIQIQPPNVMPPSSGAVSFNLKILNKIQYFIIEFA